MGRGSGVTTVSRILASFDAKSRWRQADLAREVGVAVPSLRKHLLDLDAVLPLETKRDGKDVFWEMPSGWTALGARLPPETFQRIVRVLVRAPSSRLRDELLTTLAKKTKSLGPSAKIASRDLGAVEEVVSMLEDAAASETVVRMRYLSASRGDHQTRDVSIQSIRHGLPIRFVAFCHLRGALRRFRADRVQFPTFAKDIGFRRVEPAVLERFLRRATDDYAEDAGVDDDRECSLVVRFPEARWVRTNLLPGMRAEDLAGGDLRVIAPLAGLVPTARFCVGLGAAAKAETPELGEAVAVLARGALGLPEKKRAKVLKAARVWIIE